MKTQDPQINFDQPLEPGSALAKDILSRRSFAEAAANALRKVSSSTGFALSVEGAWGSGKTSSLAMIEELLQLIVETKRPVIVHFNPWLIGDRDALLRHFLARVAEAIKLNDRAKEGKRVSKEIKSYARVFDVVKFVPGAEPWASMVKAVFESVGESAGSIAEYKTPDIEEHKRRVEDALRQYPKPVIVFIDDIDRLFPLEVFEMIRIIKAVGSLPNVGYVLAWDPTYVAGALSSVNVPQAETYVDKIVQVRMPLPSLSLSARGRLINDALADIDPDAMKSPSKDDESRLSALYFSGLRELLEQPRDVTRVFNTVRVIEPALRGEVVFSDIVGLAALTVKATPIFELLRKSPSYFVGLLPHDNGLRGESEDLVKAGAEERDAAFKACKWPAQVRRVVHFLFPMVARADDKFSIDRTSGVEGHLAHPARLLVALQMSIGAADVSLVAARTYLHQASKRDELAKALTAQNCLEFLETLGDVAQSINGEGITDLDDLCLAIATLADIDPFPMRSKSRDHFFSHKSENVALRAINGVVQSVDPTRGTVIARMIIESGAALSVAAELVKRSHLSERNDEPGPVLSAATAKPAALKAYSTAVLQACNANKIFGVSNPDLVLWILARSMPSDCHKVFTALKRWDPTLDCFALEFLKHSFDSTNGQTYGLPRDMNLLTAYCPEKDFRAHAESRLADTTLGYPARAAWKSVTEGQPLYGVDGSEVKR